MSFEFFHKQWVCDFENLTSNKKSRNGMLEVTAEDTVSARKYMQISFNSRYFQDIGENYLFSPCVMGTNPDRYDKDYYISQDSYIPTYLIRTFMKDPKFIAFDSDNLANYQAFTSAQWSNSGWTPPDQDYNGWVNNIAQSYAATGLAPFSVNLYVFKIINLKFDESFSTQARYVPLMYMGNDPNIPT